MSLNKKKALSSAKANRKKQISGNSPVKRPSCAKPVLRGKIINRPNNKRAKGKVPAKKRKYRVDNRDRTEYQRIRFQKKRVSDLAIQEIEALEEIARLPHPH